MAWNVGYEIIQIGDFEIEGQWEVDESSEVDAKNTDKIPYLLVGCDMLAYPEDQVVEWCTYNQLHEYNTGYYVGRDPSDPTADLDFDDQPVVLLNDEQVEELARVMRRLEDGVTISDFTLDTDE